MRFTSPKSSVVHFIKPFKKIQRTSQKIIGFIVRKDVVCKWNVVRCEKPNYKKFLSEPCLLNEGNGGKPPPPSYDFCRTPPPPPPLNHPSKPRTPMGQPFMKWFLVNFQACRLMPGNFTIKLTPSQVLFDSILSPPPPHPMLPQGIDLNPPPSNFKEHPHVLNTCEKPRAWESV